MTRKLGQVQRKQIKVDPDVHEEKAREEWEIMLDLAQLTLHFEIHILELGSLKNKDNMKYKCLHREIWLLTKGRLALTGQKSARMSLQIMDAEWQEMNNSRDHKKST